MTRFGEVGPPYWEGHDAYVVGGGPSLRGRDVARLYERGVVVGVNRAAEFTRCDATVTVDLKFLRNRREELARWARRHEVYAGVPEDYGEAPIPRVTYVLRVTGAGMSRDPDRVVNGLNSGYVALNVAALKRPARVFLLGFDMTPCYARDMHFHDGYDWDNGASIKYYGRWADKFVAAAKDLEEMGVEVYNANPRSAVVAFPFVTYEELGL